MQEDDEHVAREVKRKRGKSARVKGASFERDIVNRRKEAGYIARRVPLSGGTSYAKGDVEFDTRFGVLRSECKARKGGSGFKLLERWLEGNDLVIMKRDRCSPIVSMSWELFERMIADVDG